MKCNVGNTDKLVRFTLAISIAAVGFYVKSWWGLLAVVPLITGLISFWPLYKFFGLNTCSAKSVQ
jgi:hypothetical protein